MSKHDLLETACDLLISQGNLDAIETYFQPEYCAYADEKVYQGHDFVGRYLRQMRKAMPDLKVKRIQILMEADDKVTWQRVLEGTHQSDLMGIPPSGKKIKWIEMLVSRFEGDKIVEEWVVSELAGQMMAKLAKAV